MTLSVVASSSASISSEHFSESSSWRTFSLPLEDGIGIGGSSLVSSSSSSPMVCLNRPLVGGTCDGPIWSSLESLSSSCSVELWASGTGLFTATCVGWSSSFGSVALSKSIVTSSLPVTGVPKLNCYNKDSGKFLW